MDELIAFLEARLDEDERCAPRCDAADCGVWTSNADRVDFCQAETAGFHPAIGEHIARHDPARALLEVAAERRAIVIHLRLRTRMPDTERARSGVGIAAAQIRCIALAYADHPDYRPDWRP